jgi:beta-lactam-binding protein with PASTA domain
VPNVRGRKLAVAKTRIRKAHCAVGIITRMRSKPAKKGRVLSQRPKAGVTVPSGAEVSLVVGKGPGR